MTNNGITIKCQSTNSIDIFEYQIIIIKNKHIILKDITKFNTYYFQPKKIGIYNIVIIPKMNMIPHKICINYFYNFKKNTICVYFTLKNNTPVTFSIYDKYYDGLKIMKGELTLWQRNT